MKPSAGIRPGGFILIELLAAPRAVRAASGTAAAWRTPGATPGPRLEFSRFAAVEGMDCPPRLALASGEEVVRVFGLGS